MFNLGRYLTLSVLLSICASAVFAQTEFSYQGQLSISGAPANGTFDFEFSLFVSESGGGTWSVFSDERLKNVSGRYTRGIAALMRLVPIRFSYKADNALGLRGEGEYIGFSAQEVQAAVPEAVSRSTNGYLQVNSDAILWTMLNSIKEQQKQIEDQRRIVEEQERRLQKQQSEIDGLRKALCPVAHVANLCGQR